MAIHSTVEQAYKRAGIKMTNRFSDAPLETIAKGSIWHYHDVAILDHRQPDTRIIISTRDPAESAISWQIAKNYGKWHIHEPAELMQLSAYSPRYSIDCDQLKASIDHIVKFYNSIPQVYPSIDYSEWENDSQRLSELLDIEPVDIDTIGPKKNPRPLRDWVSNWEEVIATLEQWGE
jgi:hypothetical protein